MPKRFGKKRVPDCECTTSYTCGPCLRAAGPTLEAVPPPFAHPSRRQEARIADRIDGYDRDDIGESPDC